ncbi:PTS glucose transporter subunit IIABC [Spiroplasma cantharicola]|uniref:PTS system, beta-glucosides-specific IIC component n=1 Tax=Spiroplasma cantharicola TaxID=362837 RepID=A0A0M3SJD4_9MOLU|nr:PTS glucose transporter subunit IIABC [Spiroplasma cantharicola]ALD66558.1 PTS system, beta-glucosides-specific IIC component [Spiroplasma cantharicola]
MEKNIKIYSPADGKIKPLKDLNDGVFSENMLGEGVYIEPTSSEFYSPFEEGTVAQIFHTKHAFHFKSEQGPVILMHIGLDTIHLQGKPFDVKVKEGDSINLKTKIVDVDFKLLDEKNIVKSTPLVIDLNEFKGWKFNSKIKSEKIIKQGELIGELIFEEKMVEESTIYQVEKLLNTKNKYEQAAEVIYKAVGKKDNYKQVYNCMTRLRFEVLDTKKVDVETIKNINLVKGIIWAGNQIQIVIGGEVYKVKEAVENVAQGISTNKSQVKTVTKQSLIKRFMIAVGAIIMPSLPVLMASGLLMGLKTLLVMGNVITDMKFGTGAPIDMNVDLFSLFINIAAETGLKLMGVFVGYNTMKWLGGPTIMQLLLSLLIAGAPLGLGMQPDLTLFSINGFVVKAALYTSSIIPHVAMAFIIFHLDKWIKVWMPTSIDVLFRPLLIVIIAYTSIFFVLGPILFLIEQFMALIVGYLSQIPYGIGVMIFVATWQPLVLTGMHVPVIMTVVMPMAAGHFSTLMAVNIAVFAQVGAAIGVAIRTKNGQLRSTVIAAIPGGIVGVTEPILYGINLPKMRPFIAGVIAAGAFGLLSGLMGIEARTSGGLGIFGFTGTLMEPRYVETVVNGVRLMPSANNIFIGGPNSAILNCVLWLVLNIGVIPAAAGVGFLMYVERKDEIKSVKSANKVLLKYYSLAKKIKINVAKTQLAEEIKKIDSVIKTEDSIRSKEIEKVFIKINLLESKIDNLTSKLEKKKQSIISKLARLSKKEASEEQLKLLLEKYSILENNLKVKELSEELAKTKTENEKSIIEFNNWKEKSYQAINSVILQVSQKADSKVLTEVGDLYYNAINALEIGYMLIDQKDFYISKKRIRQ